MIALPFRGCCGLNISYFYKCHNYVKLVECMGWDWLSVAYTGSCLNPHTECSKSGKCQICFKVLNPWCSKNVTLQSSDPVLRNAYTATSGSEFFLKTMQLLKTSGIQFQGLHPDCWTCTGAHISTEGPSIWFPENTLNFKFLNFLHQWFEQNFHHLGLICRTTPPPHHHHHYHTCTDPALHLMLQHLWSPCSAHAPWTPGWKISQIQQTRWFRSWL